VSKGSNEVLISSVVYEVILAFSLFLRWLVPHRIDPYPKVRLPETQERPVSPRRSYVDSDIRLEPVSEEHPCLILQTKWQKGLDSARPFYAYRLPLTLLR
jgi:hypothetical protein